MNSLEFFLLSCLLLAGGILSVEWSSQRLIALSIERWNRGKQAFLEE